MSSLALLILLAVVLVLVVVIVLTMGCLAYVTHHHPSLGTPLTVAIGGASFLIACVAVAVAAVAAVLITR
ncbi:MULTISPECIES: hypothetical protein [unclassified Streptomyces]|uniref:hypothetical protein n=1 Tax=unclassified Streptomyces TaxID=2593676 RepID=UPI00224E0DDD|nr:MULTISPECIES: hypothetical protein [unclassified Streptomyces]MCX4869468.1 hypothetical protein [Streptomyces sp. NBC_00906]MCX4900707.1 hypothetical protein [Streptomyces sp. NBC_00892]